MKLVIMHSPRGTVKKIMTYSFVAVTSFCSFHSLQATPIEENEKHLVIETIEDKLKNNTFLLKRSLTLQKAGELANVWKCIWHPHTSSFFQKDVRAAQGTKVREEFEYHVNCILQGLVGSHCYIFNASHSLASHLKRFPAEFVFEPFNNDSPYSKYVITDIHEGSTVKDEIKKGYTFSLPTGPDCSPNVKLNISQNEVNYSWKLQVTSPSSKQTKTFSYSGQTSSKTAWPVDYKPNDLYQQEIIQLCKDGNYPPLLSIPSFIDALTSQDGKYYKGEYIAGALEWNISNNSDLLVVDLRQNSGGYINNLAHFLSHFLPQHSPYMVTVNRTAWQEFQASEEYKNTLQQPAKGLSNDQKFDLLTAELCSYILANKQNHVTRINLNKPQYEKDIAILIDEGTASAGEIAAGVLKATLKDRCFLIGHRTAGAVLSCKFDSHAIKGGFVFTYPHLDVLLLDGTRLEGSGVGPDREIKDASDTQACLRAALKWHKSRQAQHTNNENTSKEEEEEENEIEQADKKREVTQITLDSPLVLEKDLVLVHPNAILATEDTNIPSHYRVSSVEACPNTRLVLFHLSEPLEGYEPVEISSPRYAQQEYIGPTQYTCPENGDFVFVRRLQDGNKWKLYGMKNWNIELPYTTAFTEEVCRWIDSRVFAITTEHRRTEQRKRQLSKEKEERKKGGGACKNLGF